MEVPPLTYKQFAILSTLVEGEPRPPHEILEQLGWPESKRAHFTNEARRLSRTGLIKRYDARRRHDGFSRRGVRVYVATETGIRCWRETLDWMLFFAERAKRPGRNGILWMRPAAPKTRRPDERLPDEAETKQLLEKATPEFRLLYRARRMTGATVQQLTELNIEDVDLRAATVALPPSACGPDRVVLNAEVRALLTAAIGGRTSGPVFRNTRGNRWTRQRAGSYFCELRHRTGLPDNIVLRSKRDREH